MAARLFPPGSPDVLYLVDLSGYVFRAYHAVAPLTSPSGEPTQAVFGTVTMLERLVRERRPARLAVAMDSRSQTFRSALYPEYKAHRPAPPEDLGPQMQRCRQIVEAFGIPVVQKEGFEADDLMATLVRHALDSGLRVVLISADKDLTQLVSPNVLMWDTMRNRVYGPEEVEERYGVPPAQMRDLLALTGDSSDNVPGVPSVGPKTARDLLRTFGTLDGVYAHLDSVPRPKLRDALATHREQALLSQRLVTLDDAVDAVIDLEATRYGGRDLERLRQLYVELGFHRHLAALTPEPSDLPPQGPSPTPVDKDTDTAAAGPAQLSLSLDRAGAHEPRLVHDAPSLAALVDEATRRGRVALAPVLSQPEPVGAALLGLALCIEPGRPYFVPCEPSASASAAGPALQALRPLLESASVPKAGHELKELAIALEERGLAPRGLCFDTLLAGYLLDPETPHALEDLASAHLGLALQPPPARTSSRQRARDAAPSDAERARQSACARADVILALWPTLERRLEAERLAELFRTLEVPLVGVLARMEARGVLVDVSLLAQIGAQLDAALVRLERDAHAAAGREFNVHAPRQLEALLFDELGLKAGKRTKTARSTDADTLETLADQHPLPRLILEIRQLAKLRNTYVETLPKLVDARTGRIHTRWNQAVAATGRLASHDPNLQNIPIRSEVGRSIRKAFVAPPGHLLVSGDYSQIELRVLAHLSGDAVLGDAFRNGQDIHTRTAMEIFGVAEQEVSSELRRRAKAVNFGIIYGQGESGLAKSLGIARAEASSFIAAYFRRYEGVRTFMGRTLEAARASREVRTLFGRRRRVPEITSANRAKRLAAERVAMNTPIQGTAADLLKLAMLSFAEPVTPGAHLVLSVHDELVFEVPEPEVDQARRRIKEQMERAHPLDVPLVAEVQSGPSWAEAH